MPTQLDLDFSRPWKEYTYTAIDLETTGAYPVGAEICEVAAVKWQHGQVVDEFQSLVKINRPMGDFIIGIHGITNEMLTNAPPLAEVIRKFHEFTRDTIMVAHHAPFDMGFLTNEFEKLDLPLPDQPALCSSLLAIQKFPEFETHRLQNMVQALGIQAGTAHRALDDSKACLQVALKCMEKVGPDATLNEVFLAQEKKLTWPTYSIRELRENKIWSLILEAVEADRKIEFIYKNSAKEGPPRRMKPMGVVRSLEGDYTIGQTETDDRKRRYFLRRISKVTILEEI